MSTTPPLYELLEAAGRMGTAAVVDLAGPGWTIEAVNPDPAAPGTLRGRTISGTVPGDLHDDLVRDGVIDPPDFGDSEDDLGWVGRTDWRYRRTIELPDDIDADRIELVGLGLDGTAEVRLDGRHVATAASAFVAHRLPMGTHLAAGRHELEILFRGPVRWAEAELERLGDADGPADAPANAPAGSSIDASTGIDPVAAAVRMPARRFGTSWSPRTPGVGISGPIRLVAWSIARIAALRPIVSRATEKEATVHVVVDLDRDGAASPAMIVLIRVCDPDGRLVQYGSVSVSPGARTTRAVVPIPKPRRWWPRGLGAPDRYRIDVCLIDADSQLPLDARTTRVGLRTVSLDTEPDDHGTPFRIRVNDVPVFCRGVGWTPVGPAATIEDRGRIRERLDLVTEAGMNMVRVRGDTRYESTAFYERCDALGIMVWQDVMLAAGAIDADPLPRLVSVEIRTQAARLTTHPSVVLWCGGGQSDAWTDRIAECLREIDPSRPFWPGGPSGDDAAHGDRHIFVADPDAQHTETARFISRIGYPGPSRPESIAEALEWVPEDPQDPALVRRRRDPRQAAVDAAAPIDPARREIDAIEAAADRQARALAAAVDWHVRQRPTCSGILLDLLADDWICDGPGLVDGAGRPKPAYEAVARIFRAIDDRRPIPETGESVGDAGADPNPTTAADMTEDLRDRSDD